MQSSQCSEITNIFCGLTDLWWDLYSGGDEKMAVTFPQHPWVKVMTANIKHNKSHYKSNNAVLTTNQSSVKYNFSTISSDVTRVAKDHFSKRQCNIFILSWVTVITAKIKHNKSNYRMTK